MITEVTAPILRRLGYSLHRMSRFERVLQRELDTGQPFVFVQVGANDGISFDGLYEFVTRNGAAGLVVEPLADMYERLRYNYRAYPSIRPVRVAVHPTATSVTLHRVHPGHLFDVPEWGAGIGSMDPAWHRKSGIAASHMTDEQVPAVHLMDLLRRYAIDRLSLLQVDVEGFDEEVIRMLDLNIIRPSIIKYESIDDSTPTSIIQLLKRERYRITCPFGRAEKSEKPVGRNRVRAMD